MAQRPRLSATRSARSPLTGSSPATACYRRGPPQPQRDAAAPRRGNPGPRRRPRGPRRSPGPRAGHDRRRGGARRPGRRPPGGPARPGRGGRDRLPPGQARAQAPPEQIPAARPDDDRPTWAADDAPRRLPPGHLHHGPRRRRDHHPHPDHTPRRQGQRLREVPAPGQPPPLAGVCAVVAARETAVIDGSRGGRHGDLAPPLPRPRGRSRPQGRRPHRRSRWPRPRRRS